MTDDTTTDLQRGYIGRDLAEAHAENDPKDAHIDPELDSMLLFGQIFEDLRKLSDEHLRMLGIQIILILKTPLEERDQ